MKKQRESNIELLRIVLMLMIILFHLTVHGFDLKLLSKDSYTIIQNSNIYILILSLTCFSVNCFVFISGYYGIKLKKKSLLALVIQGVSISILLYFALLLFTGRGLNIIYLIQSFFPIIFGEWWFLTGYIGLYLLSPFLNTGIETIEKKQLLCIILLLIFFQGSYIITRNTFISADGLSILSMVIVYITGGYCRLYIKDIKHSEKLFISVSVLFFLILLILIHGGRQAISWRLTCYNSPIVILSAVLFFYSFKKIKMKYNTIINSISRSVLAVYFIHDAPNINLYLYSYIRDLNTSITNEFIIIPIICIVFIIFIVCILFEKIRSFLFKPIINIIYNSKIMKRLPFS